MPTQREVDRDDRFSDYLDGAVEHLNKLLARGDVEIAQQIQAGLALGNSLIAHYSREIARKTR